MSYFLILNYKQRDILDREEYMICNGNLVKIDDQIATDCHGSGGLLCSGWCKAIMSSHSAPQINFFSQHRKQRLIYIS